MSTQTNAIVIQIKDGVDPDIAKKLVTIAQSSRVADDAVKGLAKSLTAINGSSVSGLAQNLRAVSSASTQLRNTTAALGQASLNTSANINKLASSYQTLKFAVDACLASLQAYTPVATAAGAASRAFSTGTQQAGNAASSAASGAMIAKTEFQVLTGSLMGAGRAAGIFVANTLGLGAILQSAFAVFGVIALLEIMIQLVTVVQNVAKAYKDAKVQKDQFDSIAAGDKLLTVKPTKGFAESLASVFAGDSYKAQQLDVINAQTKLTELSRQRAEFTAQSRANEAGLTGEALQKQRATDLQKEIDLVKAQRDQVSALEKSYFDLGKSSHTAVVQLGVGGGYGGTSQAVNLGEPNSIYNLTADQRKAVAQEFSEASKAGKDLDSQIKILGFDLIAATKKEPLAALKDETKAAREQIKLFVEEFAKLKQNNNGVVTPQQEIDLFTSQRRRALPQNIPTVDTELGNATQALNKQQDAVALLGQKYADQVESIGLYSNALRVKNVQDKIDIELLKLKTNTQDANAVAIKKDAADAILQANYQHELARTYAEFKQPLQDYGDRIRAINKLYSDGAITTSQQQIALNESHKAYIDAVEPLAEYSHQLEVQNSLLGIYGDRLRIATQIQQVQEQLRQRGRSLSADEQSQLNKTLTQLDRNAEVQSNVNKLYEQNIGTVTRLARQYAALNVARDKGIITARQEQVELAKINTQLAELNLQTGKGTGKDLFTAIFGNFIKQSKGFTADVTKLYQGMFESIANGAADSLGHAIAYGESLGDALRGVAQEALSQLISGFIKLGIQQLIIHTIGQSLQATTLATTEVTAAAAAAAWAPAAAFASLASFGANAAAADTALTTTVGLADALSFLHFNTGGFVPGSGSTDTIPAMLTPGEYVLSRQAVQALGLSNADALNKGSRYLSNGSTAPKSVGGKMSVEVIHDGITNIQVQHIDENRVRIIARQEAKSAVEVHSPGVIASEIANPNSKPSKAIVQNHTIQRRR